MGSVKKEDGEKGEEVEMESERKFLEGAGTEPRRSPDDEPR